VKCSDKGDDELLHFKLALLQRGTGERERERERAGEEGGNNFKETIFIDTFEHGAADLGALKLSQPLSYNVMVFKNPLSSSAAAA
jgi:hypothetical protein